jgi:hypothetical protein
MNVSRLAYSSNVELDLGETPPNANRAGIAQTRRRNDPAEPVAEIIS